jgi:hypothetical protein
VHHVEQLLSQFRAVGGFRHIRELNTQAWQPKPSESALNLFGLDCPSVVNAFGQLTLMITDLGLFAPLGQHH